MLRFFKKKSEVEKLQETYEKLMKEWHALSTVNRSKSDEKYAEAEAILAKIDDLKAKS